MTKKTNVLLLDFCSEKNRGDDAIQRTFLDLARKYFPESKISVCTTFSGKELPALERDFENARSKSDELVGGMYPTHFLRRNNLLRKILKSLVVLWGGFVLVLLAIRLPKRLVSFFLPHYAKKAFQTFREADFAIWCGRNLRREGLPGFVHIFYLVFHALVLIALKKPVVCLNASLWEIGFKPSQALIKFVMGKMLLVSAREKVSFSRFQKLLGGDSQNIAYLPDASFYSLQKDRFWPERKHSETAEPRIGLVIVGRREIPDGCAEPYVKSIRDLVSYCQEELGAKVVVVPQVTFSPETTSGIEREIFNSERLRSGVEFVRDELSASQLMELYSKLDFVIASRMHAAIFSFTAKTPALALAYDFGAKWHILDDLGAGKWIIDMCELDKVDIVSVFQEEWERRHEVSSVSQDRLNDLALQAGEHLRLARKVYDELIAK